jgi:hypothetical protein
MEDEEFDQSKPAPALMSSGIDETLLEWAENIGLMHSRRNEGAVFTRIAEDVFVISIRGAQPLHHDRHLNGMEDANGFSQDTWNVVASSEPTSQKLLCEVGQDVFTTIDLKCGRGFYFNTFNRHAVSRQRPDDVVVLVQVDGYGPQEGPAALKRISEILRDRPEPVRV